MPRTTQRIIAAGGVIACLVASLWLSDPAQARCLAKSFGAFAIYNCDGKTGLAHRYGGSIPYSIDRRHGVSRTYGGLTLYKYGGEVGLSHRFGGLTLFSGPLFNDR